MSINIPTSGVHHITLVGSNRDDTIDFYQTVLGMPLLFEQPNLDVPEETHLYFDAGDGRLITFFVRENRSTDNTPTPESVGAVHHIAYQVSPEVFQRAEEGLEAAGYPNTGRVDRGFMDSLYFRDPNGFLIELAFYKFQPREGQSHVDVLKAAHQLRLERGEPAIREEHVKEVTAEPART
ncbi:MAG TPA: VOC family protein [Chloroflexota bacterium]|nr:VOC family protein [Chloroflexota bacterium]